MWRLSTLQWCESQDVSSIRLRAIHWFFRRNLTIFVGWKIVSRFLSVLLNTLSGQLELGNFTIPVTATYQVVRTTKMIQFFFCRNNFFNSWILSKLFLFKNGALLNLCTVTEIVYDHILNREAKEVIYNFFEGCEISRNLFVERSKIDFMWWMSLFYVFIFCLTVNNQFNFLFFVSLSDYHRHYFAYLRAAI